MKKILIIIDGMDDEPSEVLGCKTPGNVAFMPGLDFMRENGCVRMVTTIPHGNRPSSETAILNILGNHVEPGFSGRTWLEAIGSGIEVESTDTCMRCNLIKIENNAIVSHCCDDLSEDEAINIIHLLNRCFGSDTISFHYGGGYRNLLVIKDCKHDVHASPVHELLGFDASALTVTSKDRDLQVTLNHIIFHSRELLSDSYTGANGIALWSPGRKPAMGFRQIQGTVVAGTNLVKGIGKACGMTVSDVVGATGDCHTDYSAKLEAALAALDRDGFVLLHIEAADEASHLRNPDKKVEILEEIDRYVISPLLKCGKDLEITVQADHATSSVTGRHLDRPVEVVTYVLNK